MNRVTMVKKLFTYGIIITGCVLTLINLYGLTQSIRPDGLWDEPTRFENDYSIPYEEAIKQLNRQPGESDLDFSKRVTTVVSQSLTHIHWHEEPDSTRFNQLVPIWENYLLYIMGVWSGIPEYEKYHYADYKRSLKRGIGLCGDASMVMSQVLEKNGISSDIIVFPGHVVVGAHVDNSYQLFDPDYGVYIPYNPLSVKHNLKSLSGHYSREGYDEREERIIRRIFSNDFHVFDDVTSFITKKYYFEKISYAIKWAFPALLILLGLIYRNKLSTQ